MIRSLWISKTGLDAQQTKMDVVANNLANVSTNGFKRARAVFEDLLYQTIRQPGAQSSQQTQIPSGLQLGVGVRPVATESIFTQGNLQQ
nr:flagellar hook-basal body complex protein [Nitrosomonas sp.]